MADPGPRHLSFDPIAEAERQWRAHGWADAARTMAVVTSVMRAQQILLARADRALRPHRLTFARYEVLMLLVFSRHGVLPLGKIGERLQINPASVTNAVNRLERDGLVERLPNPADGRGTLARLTPAGRDRAAAATRTVNAEVFSDIGAGDEDLDALFALLAGLRRAAGDFGVQPADTGEPAGSVSEPAGGVAGTGR